MPTASVSQIEIANAVRVAFGDLRYWRADLSVSLLMLSERNADAARRRLDHELDRLAVVSPDIAATLRQEVAAFDDLATQAVDAYTQDRRVIGNSLFAQAREHSLKITGVLGDLEASLAAQEQAARDEVLRSAGRATQVSLSVVAIAVLLGHRAHRVHPALHPGAAAHAGWRGAGDQRRRCLGDAAAAVARRNRRDDACAASVPRQSGRTRPARA